MINGVIPYIYKFTSHDVNLTFVFDDSLPLAYADEQRVQYVIYRLFRILYLRSSIKSNYEIIATKLPRKIQIKLISTNINADVKTIELDVDAQGFYRDFGYDGIFLKWGGHIVDVNQKSDNGIQVHFTIPIAQEESADD